MADFNRCWQFVWENEGGECDVAGDRGGHTSAGGITQATLDDFNRRHPGARLPASVHDLDQPCALMIYRADYWRFDGVASDAIACKILDMDVNSGLPSGVLLAQRALRTSGANVAVDGCWGPATQAAVNATAPEVLMPLLCHAAEDHYAQIVQADPEQSKFLHGWLNRARKVPNV